MRYPILDGFRGFFLVFMVIVHGNIFESVFGKINHHYFGWVEDAQGFVFISGLVVGLVYGSILLKKGSSKMVAALRKRMRTIYIYQAMLIVAMLFTALAASDAVPVVLLPYADNPVSFTASSLLLLSASMHMGILPMYLYFMFITPWTLRQFERGNWPLILGLSVVSWLWAQTGLVGLLGTGIEAMARPELDLKIGIYFNVFGWQAIYVFGLYLGFRLANGTLDLGWMKSDRMGQLFYVCLAAAFMLGIYDRIVFQNLLSSDYSASVMTQVNRQLFSPLYLAAFAIDLYAITWLIVAGGQSRLLAVRKASKAVRWFFNLRFFVFLGQHSLQVFAFHIAAVYVLDAMLRGQAIGDWAGGAILAGLVVSLMLPAYLHAASVRRRKRKLVNIAKVPAVG